MLHSITYGSIFFCLLLYSFYLNEGFLQLQKIVDESIIEMLTNESVSVDVSVRVSATQCTCSRPVHWNQSYKINGSSYCYHLPCVHVYYIMLYNTCINTILIDSFKLVFNHLPFSTKVFASMIHVFIVPWFGKFSSWFYFRLHVQ